MNQIPIDEVVATYKDSIVGFLMQLINIPTENLPPIGYEFAGQEYLKKAYHEVGLEVDAFFPNEMINYRNQSAFLKGRLYKNRPNVVGKWKGNGNGRSLVLSGHMDVAPREPMAWTQCEPFKAKILDGRIYGRGACDMKGGLVAAYMAVKILKDVGWEPRGDILLESVVDEEYASGNGTIAARFRGYNADFAINLEPSGLCVCPACVGGLVLKVTVNGISGMPYTGEEIYNPVYGIAKVIEILKKYETYRLENIPVPSLWKDSVQEIKLIITKVNGGETKEHGQLGIPINAWVEFVIQTYPGEKEQKVIKEFESFLHHFIAEAPDLRNAQIGIEQEYHYIEPGMSDINHIGITTLLDCMKKVLQSPVKVAGAPFSCDLFAFEKYGNVPAVILGPVGGNLHAPDEWVDIESILTLTKALMFMLTEWCGPEA